MPGLKRPALVEDALKIVALLHESDGGNDILEIVNDGKPHQMTKVLVEIPDDILASARRACPGLKRDALVSDALAMLARVHEMVEDIVAPVRSAAVTVAVARLAGELRAQEAPATLTEVIQVDRERRGLDAPRMPIIDDARLRELRRGSR